ncbi:MAG TPA: threonine ammonia-lyase [Gaiellaceae bacterium]|nr:threonine ammonia-lyase [Gaiellaceae bacterium]
MATRTEPTLADVIEARARVAGHARVTPLFSSGTFSQMVGREVHLKAENLQRTGSFKIRGAVNRIATLGEQQRAAGVVTASAGNHGQAVAWAAREFGIPARVFMPHDAPMAKVDATRGYGARIEFAGEGYDDALEASLGFVEETGATYVHAFEDEVVIAGQGTIGLELLDQVPEVETVVLPIGGGGLCAGIATAIKSSRPDVRVVGVQAEACLAPGSGFTIADGIAVKKPGELTFSILDRLLDDLVAVSDEEIAEAILLSVERVKQVVEGAGAAALAALLNDKAGTGSGPVAVLLSGGNIDPTLLIAVMRRGLAVAGRYLVVRTRVRDTPGQLAQLLSLLGKERVNVLAVDHHRESPQVPVGDTGVELTLLTRDRAHRDEVLETMRGWGYDVEHLR